MTNRHYANDEVYRLDIHSHEFHGERLMSCIAQDHAGNSYPLTMTKRYGHSHRKWSHVYVSTHRRTIRAKYAEYECRDTVSNTAVIRLPGVHPLNDTEQPKFINYMGIRRPLVWVRYNEHSSSTAHIAAPPPAHLIDYIREYTSYGSIVEPQYAHKIEEEITLRILQYDDNFSDVAYGDIHYTKDSYVKDIEGSNYVMV